MRVRIQYKSHSHVLSNIDSVKASQEERQFDKYFQAASIMRSRDTGSVVCDISFTDITYLGAFWRDYTNGSLQEALRAVFLTGKSSAACYTIRANSSSTLHIQLRN